MPCVLQRAAAVAAAVHGATGSSASQALLPAAVPCQAAAEAEINADDESWKEAEPTQSHLGLAVLGEKQEQQDQARWFGRHGRRSAAGSQPAVNRPLASA